MDGLPAPPRSFEELFELDDDGELVVREKHSFERVVKRLESWGCGRLWARGLAKDQW